MKEVIAPGGGPGIKTLAVLCTVYNEEATIPLFIDRLIKVFGQLDPDKYHPSLFFVDNGCMDKSLSIIRNFHEAYPHVFAIVLSRNFGYQSALETALRMVSADLYTMIDVDCEDPPEMIPDFLRYHEEGYEIVYGERVDRPEILIIKSLRKLFYHVVHRIADDNFVLNMAEFSLITSEVRNAILLEATSFPFLRASIGRIGFRRKNVPYKRHSRVAGTTHYNLLSMTIFAVAGILSSSTVVLRWPVYAFPFWVASMIGIAVWAMVSPAVWQMPLLVLLGFLFLAMCTAPAGLYVARIYKNSFQRPNAIVRHGLSILPRGDYPE